MREQAKIVWQHHQAHDSIVQRQSEVRLRPGETVGEFVRDRMNRDSMMNIAMGCSSQFARRMDADMAPCHGPVSGALGGVHGFISMSNQLHGM